jgi:hypothetical protein
MDGEAVPHVRGGGGDGRWFHFLWYVETLPARSLEAPEATDTY